MDSGKQQLLLWISETSGERVVNWERVSQGDIICYILYRMRPEMIPLKKITDGVDRFARVCNWRLSAKAMRKLGIGWTYDEVKLVMADEPELARLVLSLRRYETTHLDEPLEPPSPEEWNEPDLPAWFTQQTAKEIEEKKLAAGETRTKKQKTIKAPTEPRHPQKVVRKSIFDVGNSK